MQSIARDSEESSDEEFFDAHGNNSSHLVLGSIVRSAALCLTCSVFKEAACFPSSDSACISLTTDQFLSFPDTQHALGLQLK